MSYNLLHIVIWTLVNSLAMGIFRIEEDYINPCHNSSDQKYIKEQVSKQMSPRNHKITKRLAFDLSSDDIATILGTPYYFYYVNDDVLLEVAQPVIRHFAANTCIRIDRTHKINDFTDNSGKFPLLVFDKTERRGCEFYVKKGTPLPDKSPIPCNKSDDLYLVMAKAFGSYESILRPDRDSYVTINLENMDTVGRWLYEKKKPIKPSNSLTYGIPFDYTSLALNVHSLKYTRNKRITFATKDIKYQGLMGYQNKRLSHRDKLALNTHLGCIDLWLKQCRMRSNPCKNEGFLGKNCRCVCRIGATGRYCDYLQFEDYYGYLLPKCSRVINQTKSLITTPTTADGILLPYTWCVYKIRAPKNQLISIRFLKLRLPESIDEGFLEIREKGMTHGELITGEHGYFTYESKNGNELDLYFEGGKIGGDKGFKAEVIFIKSDNGQEEYSTTEQSTRETNVTVAAGRSNVSNPFLGIAVASYFIFSIKVHSL